MKDLLDPKLKAQVLAAPALPSVSLRPSVRPSLLALAQTVQMVSTAAEAARMADDLGRLDVGFVGIDAEFQYGDPSDRDDDSDWQDPLSLRALLVGLVAMAHAPDRRAYVPVRYAVDVRRAETHAGLAAVLGQPHTFVAHHIKSELFALSALKIPWPKNVFCTWLAAQLVVLGRHHARYIDPAPVDDVGEGEAQGKAREERRHVTSLLAQLVLYDISYPFLGDKDAMRRRFLRMTDDEELTLADREYVTADAYGAAALYLSLRLTLAEEGLAHHYDALELPGALALAEIEWAGVTVDRTKIRLARDAAQHAVAAYETRLRGFGFRAQEPTAAEQAAGARGKRVMVQSFHERQRVLHELRLLDLFADRGTAHGYSFRKELLKQHRDAHEVIELLYLHGKYSSIVRDPLFCEEYICADGRVRPWINPLGADSGRASYRKPNLVGLGKVLRPVVVVDSDDHDLAELDYVAQEPFIAAAHFNDPVLLADCNAGDPYCEMIRQFCRDDLRPGDELRDDQSLAVALGAKKFKVLRDRMKILMLATMYGMGDTSIAAQAKTTLTGARRLRERFFARYAALAAGMKRAERQLQERGYTQTVTGLRRYRAHTGALSAWEKHWAVNAPIQGGGACIMKLLLPRLMAFLKPRGGRVVLPIFDAVLIQYPRPMRDEVLSGAKALMIDVMRELYPGTHPRVDVNAAAPRCWNKNGCGNSVERFLEDPEYKP